MEYEKYLPIGTVVVLKDGKKELMITGYRPITDDEKPTAFDYSGCYYPEGILDPNEAYLFNHDMIEKVLYVGYEADEEKEYVNNLKEGNKEEIETSALNNNEKTVSNKEVIPNNKTNVFDNLRI